VKLKWGGQRERQASNGGGMPPWTPLGAATAHGSIVTASNQRKCIRFNRISIFSLDHATRVRLPGIRGKCVKRTGLRQFAWQLSCM